MNDTPPAPAAWYADPTGRWDYRFWDGATWTDRVSRGGTVADDAVVKTSGDTPTSAEPALVKAAPDAAEKQGWFARKSEERQQKKAGRASFEDLARAAAHGDESALASLPAAVSEARSLWRSGTLNTKLVDVLVLAIREVMADDALASAEEDRIARTADALGLTINSLQQLAPQAFEELVIGKINCGRLPVLDHPSLLLTRGEVAHGTFAVDLMKEVTVREFRGGSSGVSVPVGLGVRYRVGAVRGRSVVVGTQLVAQDSGILTVTSKRSVFAGQKKTLEFRRDKLVGMEQFTDGIRLNVSNRQTASLFRLRPGQSASILAALIAAT